MSATRDATAGVVAVPGRRHRLAGAQGVRGLAEVLAVLGPVVLVVGLVVAARALADGALDAARAARGE